MMRRLCTLLALSFAPAALAGWQADLQLALADCASDPAPCEVLDGFQAYKARSGDLRFQATPGMDDPATHPMLLHRLLQASDPAMRLAYADLAGRVLRDTDPRWWPAWAELASTDPDHRVRHALIVGLRRAPIEAAEPGLRAAARHPEGPTRALAVMEMGGHAESLRFLPDIRAALTDAHPEVRASAAQVAGWLGEADLVGDLLGVLDDLSGEVRGYALLSIHRLDPSQARAVANRLDGDAHPRVRAALSRIARDRR